MPYMFFRKIYQRTNDRNSRSAQLCLRMKGMEPAFLEKGHEQRIDYILPVMAECQFAASQFHACIGKNRAAHFGAQRTGILFLPVIKNNPSDIRFSDLIRDFQLPAQFTDAFQVKRFQPHIHRNRNKRKILMGKFPVQ